MQQAHWVDQVREAERPLLESLPDGVLMQRAAVGLAVGIAGFLRESGGGLPGRRVLILAGSGDNGGDALWAGAWLARRGASVQAIALSDRIHRPGLAALQAAGGLLVAAEQAQRPDVVVDGIVGIGGSGPLREPAREVVARFDGVPTVAVDVPSGVGVDSGEIDGPHVTADLTITFGTLKACHLVDPAASACGRVELVDIGLTLPPAPITALQADDVAALVPRPGSTSQKYSRGVLGVRTGSSRYPGAAVLSTGGALRLVGMLRYVGGAAEQVLAAHPEVVVGAGRVQAWVVGSGGGDDAPDELEAAMSDGVPVAVDADGLTGVTGPLSVPAVLTPHAGELARLLSSLPGEQPVERDRIEAAPLHHVQQAAAATGSVVLLKGARTLVATPDGQVRVNTTGVPWLATAGSGDVLAGVVGALLAGGLDPVDAASAGAWLHGAAGTLASQGGPICASDLVGALPRVVAALLDDV